MICEPVQNIREVHTGTGSTGTFVLADSIDALHALLPEHSETVKLVYMDPPYLTGERFSMRVRVGSNDWKTGRGSLALNTFSDKMERTEYIAMMREVLTCCRQLLRPDGMIFVHIDYRTHPYMRLLMDEVFGEENFLNDIIWVYQTGGRSLRHFSRKHDVILFYRRSDAYDFNIDAVKAVPAEPRANHMRRHVDPDGRIYRSIRTNGRVYTYYDDEPVAPTDVWTDVAHLQQKDPERTGYDTQKPLSLLHRIVRCSCRKGDLVLDPFCGSSTTLEAAKQNDCDFIGIDSCPLAMNIARRRLDGCRYTLNYLSFDGSPVCESTVFPGIGFYHVVLDRYCLEAGMTDEFAEPMDAVDNWSAGYMKNGIYTVFAQEFRTKNTPFLSFELEVPVYGDELVLCVNDIMGRSFLYKADISKL